MANPLPNRTEELPDRKYYDPDTEENWADPLEAVIEEVSINAIVSGTSRSNFDPLDGQLFIPTNGGDWFIGNGTAWNNLGPIGDIGDHVADTTNPHSVTAAQADALPTSGGTVNGNVSVTGDLSISGAVSGARTVVNTTSDYTASDSDIVVADTSANAITVTLPGTTDAVVDVKVADATNTVTIATPATETIDGQTEETLSTQYQSRSITFDGTNYWTI